MIPNMEAAMAANDAFTRGAPGSPPVGGKRWKLSSRAQEEDVPPRQQVEHDEELEEEVPEERRLDLQLGHEDVGGQGPPRGVEELSGHGGGEEDQARAEADEEPERDLVDRGHPPAQRAQPEGHRDLPADRGEAEPRHEEGETHLHGAGHEPAPEEGAKLDDREPTQQHEEEERGGVHPPVPDAPARPEGGEERLQPARLGEEPDGEGAGNARGDQCTQFGNSVKSL
jgi:hypothetical protein